MRVSFGGGVRRGGRVFVIGFSDDPILDEEEVVAFVVVGVEVAEVDLFLLDFFVEGVDGALQQVFLRLMLSLYLVEHLLQGLHLLLALAVNLPEFLVLRLQPPQTLLLPHTRTVPLRVQPAQLRPRKRHRKERVLFVV